MAPGRSSSEPSCASEGRADPARRAELKKMADSLFISRSKLFYKVKGLTGETPIGFFKQYKLSRAAELLKEGKYPISQISDMTGFSSPSKFSSLFKKRFGVPPSDYRG